MTAAATATAGADHDYDTTADDYSTDDAAEVAADDAAVVINDDYTVYKAIVSNNISEDILEKAKEIKKTTIGGCDCTGDGGNRLAANSSFRTTSTILRVSPKIYTHIYICIYIYPLFIFSSCCKKCPPPPSLLPPHTGCF